MHKVDARAGRRTARRYAANAKGSPAPRQLVPLGSTGTTFGERVPKVSCAQSLRQRLEPGGAGPPQRAGLSSGFPGL